MESVCGCVCEKCVESVHGVCVRVEVCVVCVESVYVVVWCAWCVCVCCVCVCVRTTHQAKDNWKIEDEPK